MERIALITGGCQGIGKALAEEFAKNGYSLILIALEADCLAHSQQELAEKYKCEVKILVTDLERPEGLDLIMQTFKDDLPNVEVLVNNAGLTTSGQFHKTEIQRQRQLLGVNIVALTLLTHQILPYMVAKRRGKILNLASIAAFIPGPYMATYYASKAYVFSFSRALATEYQADGISVTTLCPGPVRTEFWHRSKNILMLKIFKIMTPQAVAQAAYKGLMNKKRVITPGLMNKIAVFLMKVTPLILKTPIAGYLNRPTS